MPTISGVGFTGVTSVPYRSGDVIHGSHGRRQKPAVDAVFAAVYAARCDACAAIAARCGFQNREDDVDADRGNEAIYSRPFEVRSAGKQFDSSILSLLLPSR